MSAFFVSVRSLIAAAISAIYAAFAAASGAGLIGWIQAGLGAVYRSISDKLKDSVSVEDFMTPAERADVAAGTALIDVSAAFAAALATMKVVNAKGIYRANIVLSGGMRLHGGAYGTTIKYSGAGASVLITNGGNELIGVLIETTSAAESGVHLLGASSNLLRNVVVTGNPAKGFHLQSNDDTAQTDWNNLENCAVNTAVLPLILSASGTGAVNSNTFRGPTNFRTSAATGGVVVYINGGGYGTIGNNFYDMDVSNYGGAGSKSIVMDGPGTSQTSFIGVQIDTAAQNTGVTIGSGVSATTYVGGCNQAGINFERNNAGSDRFDVLLCSSFQWMPSISQDNYVQPELLNGWVNFGAGEANAAYFKDSCGVVHIKGLVKSGTLTPGTPIFILPAGYFPTETHIFSQSNAGAFGAIAVAGNGNVYVSTAASNSNLSINCSFRANA